MVTMAPSPDLGPALLQPLLLPLLLCPGLLVDKALLPLLWWKAQLRAGEGWRGLGLPPPHIEAG